MPDEADQAAGYGPEAGSDKLAIRFRPEGHRPPGPCFDLAFAAPDRKSVAALHKAALNQAVRDNSGTGLRAHYGPNYQAVVVIDPDEPHIEAVFNSAP